MLRTIVPIARPNDKPTLAIKGSAYIRKLLDSDILSFGTLYVNGHTYGYE